MSVAAARAAVQNFGFRFFLSFPIFFWMWKFRSHLLANPLPGQTQSKKHGEGLPSESSSRQEGFGAGQAKERGTVCDGCEQRRAGQHSKATQGVEGRSSCSCCSFLCSRQGRRGLFFFRRQC